MLVSYLFCISGVFDTLIHARNRSVDHHFFINFAGLFVSTFVTNVCNGGWSCPAVLSRIFAFVVAVWLGYICCFTTNVMD